MKAFKTMKVFDCTDMPANVQKKFYDDTRGKSNDVYLRKYVLEYQKPIEVIKPEDCSYLKNLVLEPYNGNEIFKEEVLSGVKYIIERGDDIIGDWLHDNGAKVGEEVLIKHWW
jgi:hypothetical protein